MQSNTPPRLVDAAWLDAHPRVRAIHYPGLPSHPDFALAERQQTGRQRGHAIDADQRFGADQVAGRAEQGMAALDGAQLDLELRGEPRRGGHRRTVRGRGPPAQTLDRSLVRLANGMRILSTIGR